ncbi:MAG: gamma-glutamyl-gamma-aminobutyrate hydrolase family protein [bacterium]
MKPMKVLLVNNNTYYKNRLANLLRSHDLTTINYDEVGGFDTKPYDVIVLSGGGILFEGKKRSLKKFPHLYEAQIKLVKTSKKPIVGICLGCQIIGYSYGASLYKQFKNLRKGLFPIVAVRRSRVLGGQDKSMVFQSNHWIITELPKDLVCVAASDEGAEIIRHKTKPIWGVQFHPEREKIGGDGRKIFNRILKLIEEEHSAS